MLVLTSNGLSSDSLAEQTKALLPPAARRAAIIPTAAVGFRRESAADPPIAAQLEAWGLTWDFVDVETQNPGLLRAYDVIILLGGNCYYLVKHLRRQNARPLFAELNRDKLFIGISAGSLALGGTLEIINEFIPHMNNRVRLETFEAMGLTDIEIVPHRTRYLTRYQNFEERVAAYERRTGRRVYALEDGEGLFVGDDALRLAGSGKTEV